MNFDESRSIQLSSGRGEPYDNESLLREGRDLYQQLESAKRGLLDIQQTISLDTLNGLSTVGLVEQEEEKKRECESLKCLLDEINQKLGLIEGEISQ